MRKTILTKVMVGALIAATLLGGFFALGGNVTVTKAAAPTQTVVAAAAKNYKVKKTNKTMYATEDVYMRKGPGADYKKVGALTKGQKITVTGIAYKGSTKSNWSQTTYKGKNVFVCSSYLSGKKVKVAQKKYVNKLTVKKASRTMYATQAVYMRAGASKTYKVLTTLKTNQKVKVVGDCYRGKTAAGWTKVKANGKTGYVATSFLKNKAAKKVAVKKDTVKKATYTVKKAKATMYAKGAVNVRKAPSTNAKVVKVLKKGVKVKVTGIVYKNNVKTKWYTVSVNGTTGYMSNLTVEL